CAVSHGFEWGQAETFVQRGECEQFGGLVKHAEYRVRHKAEESNVLLNPAANHGQSQILMPAQLVADDDQFEIPVLLILDKFTLQNRKCFDQSMKVFVWPDLSRVQHKRILELISLQHLPSFLGRVCKRETLVESVMHNRDLPFRQFEN